MPDHFLCKLVTSTLSYRDRAYFAAHVFQNRIPLPLFVSTLVQVNVHAHPRRVRKISEVLTWLNIRDNNRNNRLRRYFAWDINLQETRNLLKEEYVPEYNNPRGFRPSSGDCLQFIHNGPEDHPYWPHPDEDRIRDLDEIEAAVGDWNAAYGRN